jgi:nucleoporin NUP159
MSLSELNRIAQTPEPEDDSPSRGYGLFYTPEGSPGGDAVDEVRRLYEMGNGEVNELVEAGRRREEVAGVLRGALKKRGVKVSRVVGRGAQ